MGHIVTSSWLHERNQPTHLTQHEWYHGLAVKDLVDVAAADCIIMDVDGTSTTGGRYCEWGFALGRYNMLKIVVGKDRTGVFTTLADHSFSGWDEVMDYLRLRPVTQENPNAERLAVVADLAKQQLCQRIFEGPQGGLTNPSGT